MLKRFVLVLAAATVPIVAAAAIAVVLLFDGSALPQVSPCDSPSGATQAVLHEDEPLSPEEQHVENLAALARLWGAVRYFHPFVAGADIDWDLALIEALPDASAATSAADFEAAVTKMLSKLNDPATRVAAATPAESDQQVSASFNVGWAPGNVLILRACYGDADAESSWLEDVKQKASSARGVVFDIRAGPVSPQQAYELLLKRALVQAISSLSGTQAVGRPEVYVQYLGYPAQVGGSQTYTRRFVRTPAESILPETSAGTSRFVFLTGPQTPYVLDLLAGLQDAQTSVVFSGSENQAQSVSGRVVPVTMPYGLVALVRTTTIEGLASQGFVPDELIQSDEPDRGLDGAVSLARARPSERHLRQEAAQAIRPLKEEPYVGMGSPSGEYRLLALFRAWNVVQYFFPYLDLMDQPWEQTLREFIPRFETAEGEEACVMTVAEFAARLGDSHVTIGGPGVSRVFGSALPGIVLSPVEGKNVVVRILDDEARQKGVNVGDVLTAVDGVPVETRAEELTKLLSGSTPQARRLRIARYLLRGQENTPVRIELSKADGRSVSVSLTRTRQPQAFERSTPVFSVLPEGFGYVDLDRVTVNQLAEAFRAVSDTPGLILDMRGYPNGVFPSLPFYLGERAGTAALFERPDPDGLHLGSRITGSFKQPVTAPGINPYRAPVVVLINEEAISQAEHTLLHLEASRKVTFVGSPTTGANGDVTSTVLPGGIVMTFTGQAVKHADGRQLQRLGVQPDIPVEPTIEGIRAGKDEVLEAGIAFLKGAVGD